VLLFVFENIWSSFQKEKIVVDAQAVDYLIRQREELEFRQLSPEERRQTIDSYVEDEILYSEAYKRGMDRGDTRMRRNMILKMRLLLISDVTEPTQEQLKTYFEANRTLFDYPPSWSLDHIFFPDSAQVPEDLLQQLHSGLDPLSVGEPYRMWGRRLENLNSSSLSGVLGSEIARAIIKIENDLWHGPFESIFGLHYLRITGRQPSRPATLEQVLNVVVGAWSMAESRKRIEDEISVLTEQYEVIIEGDL